MNVKEMTNQLHSEMLVYEIHPRNIIRGGGQAFNHYQLETIEFHRKRVLEMLLSNEKELTRPTNSVRNFYLTLRQQVGV